MFRLQMLSLLILIVLFQGCKQHAHKRELAQKLSKKIELHTDSLDADIYKAYYQPDFISVLYRKSGKKLSPFWSEEENIDQLLNFIRNAKLEGLYPEDYHLSSLEKLMEKIVSSKKPLTDELAELELLLTDSYLLLTSHLGQGKTDSETFDPQWHAVNRNQNIDWESFIQTTLKENNVEETLHSFTPKHQEYANLKMALKKYLHIQESGGWETFETDIRKLEKGITHPDVAVLRHRLSISQGEIPLVITEDDYFDDILHEQVLIFQMRNGLTADGVVGKGTIEALNITVEERLASIKANLERWRWLSDELGERYIIVNIANFELQLIENGKTLFKTEAIVGRPYRKTPVFSSLMSYLVFNPDWTIPPTILRNDVIPGVINNPNYLNERRMKVIARNGQELDPASIDWQRAAQGFQHTIRQEPGPDNALGLVKFMFPNKYHVYIHDTPARELFKQTERSFSSGCIRINHPMKLAEILLDENEGWDMDRINLTLTENRTRTVNLKRPVSVHILYLTAWADNDGIVYFRRDIYDRDKPLLAALMNNPKIVTETR